MAQTNKQREVITLGKTGEQVDIERLLKKNQEEADQLKQLQQQQLEKQAESDRLKREKDAQQIQELLREAVEWEIKADKYKDRKDIDEAIANAEKCRAEASALNVDQETDHQKDGEEVKKTGAFEFIFSHVLTGWLALLIFPILAYLCWLLVGESGADILTYNKAIADAGGGQMLPPPVGKMEEQKLWMGCVKLFLSPTMWVVIMLGVAPDKLLFILPYSKEPQKKWKNFFAQSESEKQWQSLVWSAVVWFFIAFMLQSVK